MQSISMLFFLLLTVVINQSVPTIPTFDEYIVKFNKTYSS